MPKQPRMFFPQTKSSPRSEKSTVKIELETKRAEPQIRAIDQNPTSQNGLGIPLYDHEMNACVTLLH